MVIEWGRGVGEGGEGGCCRGGRGAAWPSGRHGLDGESGSREEEGTWDVRAETRKSRTRNIRGLIPPEDRVLYCHQPSSKLCV